MYKTEMKHEEASANSVICNVQQKKVNMVQAFHSAHHAIESEARTTREQHQRHESERQASKMKCGTSHKAKPEVPKAPSICFSKTTTHSCDGSQAMNPNPIEPWKSKPCTGKRNLGAVGCVQTFTLALGPPTQGYRPSTLAFHDAMVPPT